MPAKTLKILGTLFRSRKAAQTSSSSSPNQKSGNICDSQAQNLNKWIKDDPGTRKDILVNPVIETLWPVVDKIVMKALKHHILPTLVESLPQPFKFVNIKLDSSTLGDFPARIVGAKVVRERRGISSQENLVISALVSFDGNEGGSTISGMISKYTVRCHQIVINGLLHIELADLDVGLDLAQAIRIYFVEKPDISFQLSVDSKFIPTESIREHAMVAAIQKISDVVVLPNSIGVRLNASADPIKAKCLDPTGLLSLRISSVSNLPSEHGALYSSAPSTFVRLTLGSDVFSSDVVPGSCDPVFDLEVVLVVHRPQYEKLVVEVVRRSAIGINDTVLCSASEFVEDLVATTNERTMALNGPRGDSQVSSDLGVDATAVKLSTMTFQAKWGMLGEAGPAQNNGKFGLVSVGVYDCKGVHLCRKDSAYCVKVQCNMLADSRKSEMTSRLKRALLSNDGEVGNEKLRKKIKVLQKHGVPDEEIALVLDVSEATLKNLHNDGQIRKNVQTTGSVRWDQIFHFWCSNPSEATIILTVLEKDGPTIGELRKVGTCQALVIPREADDSTKERKRKNSTGNISSKTDPDARPMSRTQSSEITVPTRILQLNRGSATLKVSLQIREVSNPEVGNRNDDHNSGAIETNAEADMPSNEVDVLTKLRKIRPGIVPGLVRMGMDKCRRKSIAKE